MHMTVRPTFGKYLHTSGQKAEHFCHSFNVRIPLDMMKSGVRILQQRGLLYISSFSESKYLKSMSSDVSLMTQ
jgi:hypothetical protein